jgi:hypothetical protein
LFNNGKCYHQSKKRKKRYETFSLYHVFFFIHFYNIINKYIGGYRGRKFLIIGAIFCSKTIGLNPTLFKTIKLIDTATHPITKNINLLIIRDFLFSVLINSFNIINIINENIQTVSISLNKSNL